MAGRGLGRTPMGKVGMATIPWLEAILLAASLLGRGTYVQNTWATHKDSRSGKHQVDSSEQGFNRWSRIHPGSASKVQLWGPGILPIQVGRSSTGTTCAEQQHSEVSGLPFLTGRSLEQPNQAHQRIDLHMFASNPNCECSFKLDVHPKWTPKSQRHIFDYFWSIG